MKQMTGFAAATTRLNGTRALRVAGVLGLAVLVANCSAGNGIDPKYGVKASPRVVAEGQAVPKGGGRYQVGKPYQVAGRTFVPAENKNYKAEGMASWYGAAFHGRLTANGEVFDRHALTAAHPTLPLPSYVRVTNMNNGRSVMVRVNDRGPFHGNRVLDVSKKTAELLDFQRLGTARVRVEYAGPADLSGSDDARLLATYREDGRNAPAPIALAMASQPAPAIATAPAPVPSHGPESVAAASYQPSVTAIPIPAPSPMLAAAPAVPASFTRGAAVAAPARPAPVRTAMVEQAATPAAMPGATTYASQRVSSTWAAVGEPMPLINPIAAASGPALAISSGR